jgi:hypothetical protein
MQAMIKAKDKETRQELATEYQQQMRALNDQLWDTVRASAKKDTIQM